MLAWGYGWGRGEACPEGIGMKTPSGRRWLIGALGLFLVLMVLWIAAAMRLSAAAAAPSNLMTSLRSRLSANYAPDPGGSTVRSLRLSIFQEVMQDLGMSEDEAAGQSQEMAAEMQAPVPTATARDFEGAKPFTATPTVTQTPTETPVPTATPTKTPKPKPTKTKTPVPTDAPTMVAVPTSTNTPPAGVDTTDPTICCMDLNPDPPATLSSCTFDVEELEVFDPAYSDGVAAADVYVKYSGPSTGGYIYTQLSFKSGGFTGGPGSDFSAIFDGTVTLTKVFDGEVIDVHGKVKDIAGNGWVYHSAGNFTLLGTNCP